MSAIDEMALLLGYAISDFKRISKNTSMSEWAEGMFNAMERHHAIALSFAAMEKEYRSMGQHGLPSVGIGAMNMLREREKELALLRMAYDAMSREGWETGPTIEEARAAISAHLQSKTEPKK
jgi:hypothetical protein